eukprot:TRINITY_DN10895_c0_g1_i13.p1 TRINITY_DN10895_c0_g1~~TRINITY_DN10895_c0_g1_i13.p1  ORF type:complete len:192 (-),score=52.98 TRINITY_DN10895_c0_g1_i13:143-718(-)
MKDEEARNIRSSKQLPLSVLSSTEQTNFRVLEEEEQEKNKILRDYLKSTHKLQLLYLWKLQELEITHQTKQNKLLPKLLEQTFVDLSLLPFREGYKKKMEERNSHVVQSLRLQQKIVEKWLELGQKGELKAQGLRGKEVEEVLQTTKGDLKLMIHEHGIIFPDGLENLVSWLFSEGIPRDGQYSISTSTLT